MARFLIRILCVLALVLAAWPAGASAAPCVEPPKHTPCAMACCAGKAMDEMACHSSGPRIELKAKAGCSCEIKAALPIVTPPEKATLPTLQILLALPTVPVVTTVGILRIEPALQSSDSSPPGDAQRRPSSPRAPPVVRV